MWRICPAGTHAVRPSPVADDGEVSKGVSASAPKRLTVLADRSNRVGHRKVVLCMATCTCRDAPVRSAYLDSCQRDQRFRSISIFPGSAGTPGEQMRPRHDRVQESMTFADNTVV